MCGPRNRHALCIPRYRKISFLDDGRFEYLTRRECPNSREVLMPADLSPDPATAANPAIETRLPAGLPVDWHLDRDLPCPQCRYNLRMLRDPRCPECGTKLRWQQVLFVVCPRCRTDGIANTTRDPMSMVNR